MMKKCLLLFMLVLSMYSMQAQEEVKSAVAGSSQSIYGEFLGNGIVFSVNYDVLFKGDKGFGARAGLGFLGVNNASVFTVPLGLFHLSGKAPHYFEAGFGVTYMKGTIDLGTNDKETGDGFTYLPTVGYRFAPLGKNFTGRVYFGPLITGSVVLFPWGGVSIGYKFR